MAEVFTYAVRFTYTNGETATGEFPSWLAAKQNFDGWKANKGHYEEVKSIELVVRGKVEEKA